MVSMEWRKGRRAGGIGCRLVIHCLGILCLRKTSNDIVSVCSDVKNTFTKDGVAENRAKERKQQRKNNIKRRYSSLHCGVLLCYYSMDCFFSFSGSCYRHCVPSPEELRSILFRAHVPASSPLLCATAARAQH